MELLALRLQNILRIVENRLLRWTTTQWPKSFVVNQRVRRWKAAQRGNKESGAMCLINEMQILVSNGWAHV